MLTRREREVMALVVSGLLNKQIASKTGAQRNPVKVHRAQVMHKMQAGSLAELVRMAEKLHLFRSSRRDQKVISPNHFSPTLLYQTIITRSCTQG
jgi:DNA-binding CsgD family transcriptional regulator